MPSVVLFDGVCSLCDRFVQFVIARDPAGRFRFGALQSAAARDLLASHAVPDSFPDSMALIEDGRLFIRSSAALRIARRLTFPWPLAYALIMVPRPIRDWFYDRVAQHRYRWFGQRSQCLVPTPELRSRFLD